MNDAYTELQMHRLIEVELIPSPFLIGLFDMEISIEDARKEIVKCIEMSKHGIHAMLMAFSAESRFSCEEQKTVESIKLFFGDKILDHIILVFTRGDVVGDEIVWKKMLAGKSPAYLKVVQTASHLLSRGWFLCIIYEEYHLLSACLWLILVSTFLQDMLKLCQNRVVLFDNKTSNIEHLHTQRKKLLDVVDSVISSN